MPEMPALPEITVGTAIRHRGVTALPIFAAGAAPPRADYELGAAAIERGELQIHELARGQPDQLTAYNRGGRRALLLEGDHLLGARQNRMLTSSVLVGKGRKLALPVSCVEQGRWHGPSARFDGVTHIASPRLRRIAKHSVTRALLGNGRRGADQSQIWQHIAQQQRELRVTSATAALSHTYAARGPEITAIADQLRCPDDAIGVALGVGSELVSIDVFDHPLTCAHYWRRLIEGAALDSLGTPRRHAAIGDGDIARLIDELRAAAWARVAAIGDGDELRAQVGRAAASVLMLDGAVVHFGVATAAAVDLPLAVMRHDLPASLAARFQITGRIGAGGSKEVFRAVDRRGGPDVAIARMPFVDRSQFDDEVAMLRRVDSQHVPRIFEAVVDEHGDGYLVMERCDGPSLAQVVGRGAMALADAAPILVAFARGLRAIHDAFVLHHDIKLENVMLSAGPDAPVLKILDFGLSARAASTTTAVASLPTSGTLPYMAPEVAAGRDVDARADVYAFGVCCYRILAGKLPIPPRDDESAMNYLMRLRDAAADTSGLPAALPAALRAMIERMLDPDLRRRPFMPEVVDAFERALGAAPPVAAPHAATPSAFPLTRAHRIPVALRGPEHLVVAECPHAPLVTLTSDGWGTATHVRAIAGDGAPVWSRRLDGCLITGIRADLDGDGVREIYLAGAARLAALTATGEVRFARAARVAPTPSLFALVDRAAPRLIVDGRMMDPASGVELGTLARLYHGDGRTLVAAEHPRGVAYNGLAHQGFCGDNGTAAAVIHHPGDSRFAIAQLEDTRFRRVELCVYGPGGARLHRLAVADCPIDTGDIVAISRLNGRDNPLFGPEHAPIAVLAADRTAVVIAPLVGPYEGVPSTLVGFELPSGRELWRCSRDATIGGARMLLADLEGNGRPQLVIGDGQALIACDPWTGRTTQSAPCKGLPVAFGDPLATGYAHLITAAPNGIELWRGPACRPGAMMWTGARGDLWRTGTLRSDGQPFGPV